jgi:hypothetical protein
VIRIRQLVANAAARRHRRGQSGVTLVEVLVGIAVMVPLTLASVSGLMLAVRTSDATERHQRLEMALSSATEDLKALPYLRCGLADQYDELYEQFLAPLTGELLPSEELPVPQVVEVDYWSRTKDGFLGSCSGDDGAQRLTVQVSEEGEVLTGTVVTRDPTARVGNS